VGRQAEIQAVRYLLGRLRRGRGAALVITGEAGVGKTMLLSEAGRLADRRGILLVRTAALPLATQLPRDVIGGLLEALRAAGRIRSARLPAGTAGFRALASRLASAAAAGPVCLAVDDGHWADAATIDLLQYGIARLADVPVGWLLAARPGGAAARIGHDLVSRGLARGMELRPFSAAETEALLQAHLGNADVADLSSVLHRRTGGNPLLLTEVIRAGLTAGQRPAGRDLATLVPGSVSDWLAGRLAVLPAADGDVLAWVALLPEPVQFRWLAALCPGLSGPGLSGPGLSGPGLSGPGLRASLARLTAERILDDGADGIRFRHSLIRDAATRLQPTGEYRRRAQAAVGVVAAEPPQVRLPLLEAAGRDAEAGAAYLRLADQALSSGGGADAGRLYQRAETLSARAGQVGTRLDATAGRVLALLQAARKDEAVRLAGRLLGEFRPVTDDTRRLSFLTRYALALRDHASDLDAASRVMSEASSLIAHADGRPLAEALLARAFVLTMSGHPAAATPDAERAVQMARELGDPVLEARALNRLGLAVGQAVAAPQGMQVLRRALALAETANLATETSLACLNLSYLAAICNDSEAMREWALRGLAVPGLGANHEAILRSNAGDAFMLLGDLDSALAYVVSARAVAAVIGPMADDRVAVSHGNVLALRGDLDQARRVLSRARFLPGSLDHCRLLEVCAIVDEEDGKLADALAGYQAGADRPEYPNSAWCLAGAVRTAVGLGDLDAAREAARNLDRLARRWPAAGWLGTAGRGWLALAAGDRDAAAGLFAAAAAASSETFEKARLTLAAGLAGGDGRQVQRACDAYAAMGAKLAAQRARAAARQAAISVRPAPGRRGTLTGRELEVAMLVAAGKTNAEIAGELFVSVRTVEHHVEHILAKLGFRSRVDIAAQVAAGRLPAT